MRDVHETVDIVLQLHNAPKAMRASLPCLNQVADFVFLIDYFPGIFGELFDPKADPLVYLVDVDHDGFDFIAFLKTRWVIDLAGPA